MFGFKKKVTPPERTHLVYDDFRGVKMRKGARRPVADPVIRAMAAELEAQGWIRERLLDDTVIVYHPGYEIGYADDFPPVGTRPLGTGEYLYKR